MLLQSALEPDGGANRISARNVGAVALFALATAILAVVLIVGIEVEGVRRWLAIGPLQLQPGLIVAPLILALVASKANRHWGLAALVPLALVAVQPDAATAAALAPGIAVVATANLSARRGWSSGGIWLAFAAPALAILALLFLSLRTPPPVAFVEGTGQLALISGPVAFVLNLAAILLALAAMLARNSTAG